MPSEFRENAEDLNTADPVQVDVNAIRARLEAVGDRPWSTQHNGYGDEWWFGGSSGSGENVLAFGDDDLGVLQGDCRAEAELIAHAPTDLRRLLDENARLNAELDEWRNVGAQANQGLKDAAVELEARNNEITRMGKEIVKANTAFAAIREIEPRLRHIVGDGTRSEMELLDAVEVLVSQALDAAPEMPRPPAEEGTVPTPSIHAQSDEQPADDSTEGATE